MVKVAQDGKAALTNFELLSASAEASLVVARPVTGRTHQIRVHAASADHPLGGDDKYGLADFNAHLAQLGLRRLALHAEALHVRALGLDVSAPLDPSFSAVIATLGLAP